MGLGLVVHLGRILNKDNTRYMAVGQKNWYQNGPLVSGKMGTNTCGLPLRLVNFEPRAFMAVGQTDGSFFFGGLSKSDNEVVSL